MSQPIEDYAMIGDLHTSAIVGRDGSIDWLCLPNFTSEACFARLLGTDDHGFWRIAPAGPKGTVTATRRRYRDGTLVLDTEFDTADGTIRVTDCMPIREHHPQVVRLVEGVRGTVPVRMELKIRFGYGQTIPWVTSDDHLLTATAGPNSLALWTRAETHGEDMQTVAEMTLREGQQVPFILTWYPSHERPPPPRDPWYVVADTEAWWQTWSSTCTFRGNYSDAVLRSLITLKALTYEPSGGIVAAATTSLPEALGGNRNWDYRYCWLRDATLTLESLMSCGYHDEAMAWRDWLLRAAAGDVSKLQIMYGTSGERRLDEWEVGWLPGYEGSAPVRIGNAAADQYQLDVYGEVMSALYAACQIDGLHSHVIWSFQSKLIEFLEDGWKRPDDGIWEVRGPRRHFTHSKVMAWVAVDRAVRTMEAWPDLEGSVDRLRALRDEIHSEVCEKGFNTAKQAFTQYYGSDQLDASILMMPLVGFLPPTDPRVVSTVEAIERELVVDGFVLRYRTTEDGSVDGLTGREGAFLACSFWLADCLHMIGRVEDATELFERLLGLCNEVGLLSEEYDPVQGRLVGNFPQAFSHVSLVNTACRLTGQEPPTADQAQVARRMRRVLTDNIGGGKLGVRDTKRVRRGLGGLARHRSVLPMRDVADVVPPPTTGEPARRREGAPDRDLGPERLSTAIAPGVVEIDTLLGGWRRVTAGYLIEGPAPLLVETGSQSSVPVLLEALGGLGVGPSDLSGVVVTHIHLDHAGGVGNVARAFPDATVFVHEKGARHLADPTRLVDSAARVYGPLLDSLYGRLDATPAERVHVLADGEEIRVGPDRVLVAVDSPGHAKHHVGLHDSVSGILFAGDAVGVRLPDAGVLRPSTPPPDFDLEQALHSLRRFAERRPTGIALAHYGLLPDPLDLLSEAEGVLRQWAETAERAFREGRDVAAALADRFDPLVGDVAPEHREKLEIMNGVHSNAAGLRRWLEHRES